MQKTFQKTLLLSFVMFIFVSSVSLAHQPRITESRQTEVTDPEVSKAYYGELTGQPDVYAIRSGEPFDLYVNVLVPDIVGQKKDVSAVVIKDGNVDKPLAVLDGLSFEWKQFYEPFGADSYWMGPEYKARAEAGTYEIRVSSPNNDSKYSLAIGEIEAFDLEETMNALTVIPKLKKNFFEVSPIGFIRSPFGLGLIVATYLLAFIFGISYRAILRRFAKGTVHGVHKNIGKPDRLIRLIICIALFLWAVTTSWDPFILFVSGFALFEAVFSWCGFYAAIGKNTCPLG